MSKAVEITLAKKKMNTKKLQRLIVTNFSEKKKHLDNNFENLILNESKIFVKSCVAFDIIFLLFVYREIYFPISPV